MVKINSRAKAQNILRMAEDKKSISPAVLDLRKVSGLCDYFVILEGSSAPQVRAIAEWVREGMRRLGERLHHREADGESTWLVLDYYDVIVHVFESSARRFYDLERLWSDAPRVNLKTTKKNQAAAS